MLLNLPLFFLQTILQLIHIFQFFRNGILFPLEINQQAIIISFTRIVIFEDLFFIWLDLFGDEYFLI